MGSIVRVKHIFGIIGDIKTFKKREIFFPERLTRMMLFRILNITNDGFQLRMCI